MASERECDLCALDCGKYPFQQKVGELERFFCCAGCMNVYVILWESGSFEPGKDFRQTELYQRSLKLGLISNRNNPEASAVNPGDSTSTEELLFHVSGMWCTSCAWLIEHAVNGLPGVTCAEASFASDLLKVVYHPQTLSRERIASRVGSLGYKAEEYSERGDSANNETRDLLIRTGVAAFLWINIMSFSLVLYAGYFEQISGSVRRGLPFVLMALATPVVFYCAQPVLNLAWRGVINRAIRMELLLAIGILAAYAYSIVQAFRGDIHLYFDTASAIVTLVLAGKLIERSAKDKATTWVTALHRMLPNKVRLLSKGVERFVNVAALEPGQMFVVKAGERVPADGVVAEGESHIDESLLSGESSPIQKRASETVAAGSISLDGILKICATRTASDSTLSRIISLVDRAFSSRSHIERVVDRVSRIFVPAVVVTAALTFLLTWRFGVASPGMALMRAITVLVIACPCALGMATPLAITAAFGSASRRGILVRDSRVLETLPKIDTVILDKTGTVTEGKFSLLEVLVCDRSFKAESIRAGRLSNSQMLVEDTVAREDLRTAESNIMAVVASLEQYSEHPLGHAVMEHATRLQVPVAEALTVEIHKGRGITGQVAGKSVFVGNRRLLKEAAIPLHKSFDSQAERWEQEGKTVAFAGWEGELRALAVFGDRIKPEAAGLIDELKKRGVEVRLVSGDAASTTAWTAIQLGIDSYQSEVLPEEKAAVVQKLQGQGAVVAMVGDGINDAPALAQADLGIAMGSGTDIAMRASAVVLMSDSLDKVTESFDLAHKAIRIVRQNLFWAFLYNSLGISLAVAGILNPIIAACAMLLSSTSVVGNSLRLTRKTL